jgi:hypothetical protein
MNKFTLLYKVGIQFFYKVVHIIQKHVLVYYYYNHSLLYQVLCFGPPGSQGGQLLEVLHRLSRPKREDLQG